MVRPTPFVCEVCGKVYASVDNRRRNEETVLHRLRLAARRTVPEVPHPIQNIHSIQQITVPTPAPSFRFPSLPHIEIIPIPPPPQAHTSTSTNIEIALSPFHFNLDLLDLPILEDISSINLFPSQEDPIVIGCDNLSLDDLVGILTDPQPSAVEESSTMVSSPAENEDDCSPPSRKRVKLIAYPANPKPSYIVFAVKEDLTPILRQDEMTSPQRTAYQEVLDEGTATPVMSFCSWCVMPFTTPESTLNHVDVCLVINRLKKEERRQRVGFGCGRANPQAEGRDDNPTNDDPTNNIDNYHQSPNHSSLRSNDRLTLNSNNSLSAPVSSSSDTVDSFVSSSSSSVASNESPPRNLSV